MTRKRNSIIADMEEVLGVWIKDETSYNIPLSQSLIQNKAVTSLQVCEGREVGKLQKKSMKLAEVLEV